MRARERESEPPSPTKESGRTIAKKERERGTVAILAQGTHITDHRLYGCLSVVGRPVSNILLYRITLTLLAVFASNRYRAVQALYQLDVWRHCIVELCGALALETRKK